MISLGYFIQNLNTNKFWAGDCLWGDLECKTNKWNGPRLSEDLVQNRKRLLFVISKRTN